MLSAMVPMTPITPRRYKLGEIRTLARAFAFVEHFLLTMGERFRLHAFLLVCGFKMLLPAMTRSRMKIVRSATETIAWARFDASIKDFRTLDREHVEAVRALLASAVAAERVVATR